MENDTFHAIVEDLAHYVPYTYGMSGLPLCKFCGGALKFTDLLDLGPHNEICVWKRAVKILTEDNSKKTMKNANK